MWRHDFIDDYCGTFSRWRLTTPGLLLPPYCILVSFTLWPLAPTQLYNVKCDDDTRVCRLFALKIFRPWSLITYSAYEPSPHHHQAHPPRQTRVWRRMPLFRLLHFEFTYTPDERFIHRHLLSIIRCRLISQPADTPPYWLHLRLAK